MHPMHDSAPATHATAGTGVESPSTPREKRAVSANDAESAA
jgi:hypothetical protein